MRCVKDEYIPGYSTNAFRRMLSKLTVEHLSNLALVWCKLKKTRPQLKNIQEYRDNRTTPERFAMAATNHFTKIYKITHGLVDMDQGASPPSKRQLIDSILHQYWRHGLNVYQVAMLDTQTMILGSSLETNSGSNKEQSHKWARSEIINDFEEPVSIQQHYHSSSMQQQIGRMSSFLKEVHVNHIYVCQHPKYPAMIIRIQLFDTVLPKTDLNGNTNNVYKRPFFLVVFNSSTYVAHSHFSQNFAGASYMTDILAIITSFENAFSSPDSRIHVKWRNLAEKQLISSNLETIFLASCISRFANCTGGEFIRYAVGDIDESPLDCRKETIHQKIKENEMNSSEDEITEIRDANIIETMNEKRITKIANRRFLGNVNGKQVKDSSNIDLYHVDDRTKKRVEKLKKLKIIKNIQKTNFSISKFSSAIPVEYVHFDIVNTNYKRNANLNFGISFAGNDIFAGLYELALTKNNNDNDVTGNRNVESLNLNIGGRILNPITMPSWITGENGFHGGIVRNGIFKPNKEALIEKNNNEININGNSYFNSFKSGGGII